MRKSRSARVLLPEPVLPMMPIRSPASMRKETSLSAHRGLEGSAVFFVAVGEDGAVRGYVGMHHILDEADITNVAVFPAARRQGVGRALIQAVADYAAKQALVRVTLEVRASNAAAIALYEGFGFVQDGRRPRFYSDPTEDALLYSRYTLQ